MLAGGYSVSPFALPVLSTFSFVPCVCLGIDEIAANQEEIFGRPPNGKYVSPDASSLDLILVTVTPYNSDSGVIQRWAADVSTSRQHFDTVDRSCEQ